MARNRLFHAAGGPAPTSTISPTMTLLTVTTTHACPAAHHPVPMGTDTREPAHKQVAITTPRHCYVSLLARGQS